MAEEVSLVDVPSGIMMPWAILLVLFGGMGVMALVMLRVDATSKAGSTSLVIGTLAVPAVLHVLPFWAAFYAPWFLGVALGSALGALLVLAVLIAGPLNLVSLLKSHKAAPAEGSATHVVNQWFKDRIQIVFGILGVVSEVGSSRAELETAKLRAGMLSPDHKHRR